MTLHNMCVHPDRKTGFQRARWKTSNTQKQPRTCNTTWINGCNKVRRMSLFAGRVTLHKSGIMEDVYARELSWPKSSTKWTQLLWGSALHMYIQDILLHGTLHPVGNKTARHIFASRGFCAQCDKSTNCKYIKARKLHPISFTLKTLFKNVLLARNAHRGLSVPKF